MFWCNVNDILGIQQNSVFRYLILLNNIGNQLTNAKEMPALHNSESLLSKSQWRTDYMFGRHWYVGNLTDAKTGSQNQENYICNNKCPY